MRELVGQDKPFHSAIDRAAGLLKRRVGTGAEFMKELMALQGIKQSEITERGLGEIMGMPKMTHEQFMDELGKRPVSPIQEKVLGEAPKPLSKEVLRRNANDLIRVRAREYASEGADTSAEYRRLAAEEMQRLRSNHMDQALRLAEERAPKNSSPTYHEQYTLPGGDNYREMLIKAPHTYAEHNKLREQMVNKYGPAGANSDLVTPEDKKLWSESINKTQDKEPFHGVSAHFGGEKNILASMRLKDRTGPNGEKLLHLEELQSDWHQQGRESGYKRPETGGLPELKEGWKYEDFNGKIGIRNPRGILVIAVDKPEDAIRYIRENSWAKPNNGVPDAPFKKNWEEMALKRLIHHAAEKGYHGIVVTPGAEQADRYNLAKHISGVDYIRNELKPQRNEMIAYDPKGNVIFNEFGMTPEKLEQHIGKEAAQKLLSQEAKPNQYGLPTHSLRGEQLIVGGKGMKKFYDEKVPNILNAIGKKYGVKTHLHGHQMNIHHDLEGYMPRDQMEIKNLHHFPITEEMRKDILANGLPLYSSGGEVDAESYFFPNKE